MNAPAPDGRRAAAGYGDVLVLPDISFEVPPGSIVAIVGANGAGKTTLLSAIAGLIPARHGRMMFGGEDVTGHRAASCPSAAWRWCPRAAGCSPS